MHKDVLLGVVIGAQGLKGEVKVKTFTESPETLAAYGPLHDAGGRAFRVASCRAGKDVSIVAFEGIADRTAAEGLKGTELFVAREALPQTAAQEFYHADLVGLRAEDGEGRVLGKVSAIHNFGAGDVIEIAREDGSGTVLLPFTREFAPLVDPGQGRIVIAVPEEVEAQTHGTVE